MTLRACCWLTIIGSTWDRYGGSVYRMRAKAERLGVVEAEDQAEALARAFDVFDIAEGERWRISVQPE